MNYNSYPANTNYQMSYPTNQVYGYQNSSRPRPNQPVNQNDDRFVGGFLGPFILGGITGGLLAPAFYPRQNYNSYYPPYYSNNYYYPPYYYYRPY